MPHIDGMEGIIYEGRKEKRVKVDGREQRLRYYNNIRRLTLATLGSKCGCGEGDPTKLQLVALTKESKGWSQVLFYKRLIDAFREGGNPQGLGKIVCGRCRFGGMRANTIARKERLKGTGEIYWIAGERVEQVRKVKEVHPVFGLIAHPRYEDLGIEVDKLGGDDEG